MAEVQANSSAATRKFELAIPKTMRRAAAAALIMLCHTFVGGVTVICMSGLEWLLVKLGDGKVVLVYDRWPLNYLFQTMDLSLALVVGGFGLKETIDALRGHEEVDE